ncbi:MAG: hypothetical protein JWN04_1527 [Myxococcaceae bacterium]|nr:hypothetical protein [Myxococcaceae bacterium]
MSYMARLLFLSAVLLIGCASSGGSSSMEPNPDDADPSTADDSGTTSDSGVAVHPRDSGQVAPKPPDAGSSGHTDAGSLLDGGQPPTHLDAGQVPSHDDAAVSPPSSNAGRCVKKPSEVMIVGDSYINWPTHTLPAELDKASGQTGWRMNAIGGASMATGGIATLVPQQFEGSYALDMDVHTVVMDGGGNDVLLADATLDPAGDCKGSTMSPTMPNCQKIVQTATDALGKLFVRMAGVGIRDVTYFYYPHVPEGTLLGGAHPNVINDYSRPKFKDVCDKAAVATSGKLRCHFVDMVPVFQGHDDWFFPGDIHPTSAASPAMAAAIWKVMKDNCVGQLPTSGCCVP